VLLVGSVDARGRRCALHDLVGAGFLLSPAVPFRGGFVDGHSPTNPSRWSAASQNASPRATRFTRPTDAPNAAMMKHTSATTYRRLETLRRISECPASSADRNRSCGRRRPRG